MQHELPVAEIDPLGKTGGAGGIERSGPGVLVEVREIHVGGGSSQQVFVFAVKRDGGGGKRAVIMEHDICFYCIDTPPDLFDEGKELAVHHQYVVLGVVDGEEY